MGDVLGRFLLVSLVGCAACGPVTGERATIAETPSCPIEQQVIEPGCDGPPVVRCEVAPGSLPTVREWCTCDGQTVQTASERPPTGTRYSHAGACEVPTPHAVAPSCPPLDLGCGLCPTGQHCDTTDACDAQDCVCDVSGSWICNAGCVAPRCVPNGMVAPTS